MDLFSYLLGKKAGLKKATKVIANPELTGTEENLTGLQVGDEKYKVSEVNANPTLAGTESNLQGIEVDGTKYKIDNLEHYSTNEKVVGTWIDGKPLYEKTIVYDSAITSQETNIPHNINNIDVAFIVSGFAKFQNQYFTFSSYTSSSNFICAYDIGRTSIDVYTGSGWRTAFENGMTIIIRYTKTTDVVPTP